MDNTTTKVFALISGDEYDYLEGIFSSDDNVEEFKKTKMIGTHQEPDEFRTYEMVVDELMPKKTNGVYLFFGHVVITVIEENKRPNIVSVTLVLDPDDSDLHIPEDDKFDPTVDFCCCYDRTLTISGQSVRTQQFITTIKARDNLEALEIAKNRTKILEQALEEGATIRRGDIE